MPVWPSFPLSPGGQKGYHHWTEINKIYKIGQGCLIKDGKLVKNNSSIDYDLSDKSTKPLGGFVHYNEVAIYFFMFIGCVVGTNKWEITLFKSLVVQNKRRFLEKTNQKLIDTSSNVVCFHIMEKKKTFMGRLKKDLITKEEGP